ncbi:MAG: prolipoprotein diacylglyceryl transferase [Parcubacteria group bacterium]
MNLANPGFTIGPLRIYYYGLILALALLVGYFWARRRARRYRVPTALIDTALLVVTPLAVLGARLYFVLFNYTYFAEHPVEILDMRSGGLAIHGALLGGALGLALVWLRYRHVRFSTILDVLAPVLLLSQAIGRLANYVNQEAFGQPTRLPWGIYISPEQRPAQYLAASHFHPTFAYEAIWNLLGLWLVLWLERRLSKRISIQHGLLFAVYVAWYSLGRFWIEALRTDALYLGLIKIAQLVSLIGLLGSSLFIWYRIRQWRRSRTT